MVIIATTGHISGVHFPWYDVPFYVLGKALGAIFGVVILMFVIEDVANIVGTLLSGSLTQSFGLEVF